MENTETEKQEKPRQPFHPYKERETPRAFFTMMRGEYRMVTRYFSLVDSKANIMIHLNSIIISGVVVFIKVASFFTTLEIIVLFFFIITSIISLTFAAMAARPIPLENVNEEFTSSSINEHLFNAQHFSKLAQDEYETAFDTVMRDQGLIFKNMSNQLFCSSKVLAKKFKNLRYSYNIFLLGIGLTAMLFIITRLITHF